MLVGLSISSPSSLDAPEAESITSTTISLSSLYAQESILLRATIVCATPRVKAGRACSLVCPSPARPLSTHPGQSLLQGWQHQPEEFRNHVLDEISMTEGINNGKGVLGALELPEGNSNGDTREEPRDKNRERHTDRERQTWR